MGDGGGEGKRPGGTEEEQMGDEQHLLNPNTVPQDEAHDNLVPVSTLQSIEEDRILPPHRAGTMPVQPRNTSPAPVIASGSAKKTRGRSESSPQKPQDSQRQLSPRSRLFGRTAVHLSDGDTTHSSPERPERHVSTKTATRPRANTSTAYPQFQSPGMRPRMGTWATGARARNGTIRRRPTVRMQPAQDADMQSNVDFSLAGAPVEILSANQPYVDPGYADLNPAYEQPANTRPVWGLAGPLPRVVRSGMIPAREELRVDVSAADGGRYNQQHDVENDGDLEQGRTEPTMRLGRMSSQLQDRQRRENRILQSLSRNDSTYSRTGSLQHSVSAHSPVSPAGTHVNQPFSPISQGIKEDDGGLTKLNDIPEIEGGTQTPEGEDWYPDDAASAKTEHEEAGNWEGEEFPLNGTTEDEIYNIHTRWSVIRLKLREPLAEFLAVSLPPSFEYTPTNSQKR